MGWGDSKISAKRILGKYAGQGVIGQRGHLVIAVPPVDVLESQLDGRRDPSAAPILHVVVLGELPIAGTEFNDRNGVVFGQDQVPVIRQPFGHEPVILAFAGLGAVRTEILY